MENFKTASKLLISSLAFLKDYDYVFDKQEISESNFLGTRLVLHYQSIKVDRKIRIYYSDGLIHKVSVFIDSSRNDGYQVSEYLSENHQAAALEDFERSTVARELIELIRMFETSFRKICEHCIKAEILGLEWFGKPFVWTPYK